MSEPTEPVSILFVGDHEVNDVAQFHVKFGMLVSVEHPVMLAPDLMSERIQCIYEELEELRAAAGENDMLGMADAMIDLVYFVKGTAVMMGLPWRELWNDVHGANMRKVRGKTHRGHAVDVKKPADWVGPQTEILRTHGFDVRRFLDQTSGRFDESLMARHPTSPRDPIA